MSPPIFPFALGFEAEPPPTPSARTEQGFDGLLAIAVSDFLSLGTEPPQAKPVKRGKKGDDATQGDGGRTAPNSAPGFIDDFAAAPSPAAPCSPASGGRGGSRPDDGSHVLLDAALGFHAAGPSREASAKEGPTEDDESLPELPLDDEPRDSFELSDNDALAVQLDRMGIDVEVRGLAVPHEPVRFSDAPSTSEPATMDIGAPAPEIVDSAAAMDLRALEVRDGVTVRVNDQGQAWEIDVVRRDNTLDLAIRADAPVREIISAEQDSIRAAVAREGYQLGSLDIADRPVETAQAVKAPEASQSLDNTSGHMSHENPNSQARREELPPWPAPRPSRSLNAAKDEPTRQGRLDRDA